MNLAKYNCGICGMEFEAACFSELQEKLKAHRCPNANKRVERTKQLQQAKTMQFVNDVAVDRIHQHKFDQLVNTGMIRRGNWCIQSESWLDTSRPY